MVPVARASYDRDVPGRHQLCAVLVLLCTLACQAPQPSVNGANGAAGAGESPVGSDGLQPPASDEQPPAPEGTGELPAADVLPMNGAEPAPDAGAPSLAEQPGGGVSRPLSFVPEQGVWLGQYYGAANIAMTTTKLGRTLRIHLKYFAWDEDWTNAVREDLDAGRIPLLNWDPEGIDFHDIVSGAHDANIAAHAQSAKALGANFFLDFAAEMNGDPAWSGGDAALYVAAYRHIHDLFMAAGADNVVWAWCPNVTDIQGGNDATLSYYPGDAYVDWMGVDGYNWGQVRGRNWHSFAELFANIYPLLAAKGKPIIIGETASTEVGGNKGAWIDAIVPSLRDTFPMIKALVWFDIRKETDWRISSSARSQAAFIRMAADPYCNP